MFSVIAIIIKYDYDDILHVIIVLIVIVYYNPFSVSSTYAYLPFFLALLSLSLLSCFLLSLFFLPALSTHFSLFPFFYRCFTFHACPIIPFIFFFFSSFPFLTFLSFPSSCFDFPSSLLFSFPFYLLSLYPVFLFILKLSFKFFIPLSSLLEI